MRSITINTAMRYLTTAVLFVTILSCNQKTADNKTTSPAVKPSSSEIDKVMDSLLSFKPFPLTIQTEKSDVDEFIPIGYNEEGSIAYFISENTGGSSAVRFDIVPSFGFFTMQSSFDQDMWLDSILPNNKEFIYHSLKTAKIKLDNKLKKISFDSLKARYKYVFEIKKTMGPPDPEWDNGKKTLASISMSYHAADNNYPVWIMNKSYVSTDNVYDIYISDCFTVRGRDGEYGYMVIVTERLGFEGYTRKTIQLESLGLMYQ